MDDESTTLAQLKQFVREFRDRRDWRQFHNPKDLAIAISIESAELLEKFLWKDAKEVEEVSADLSKKEEIQEELADILLFCLSFTETTGIDLSQAIQAKLEKNETKYPADKARGTAKKYTEL